MSSARPDDRDALVATLVEAFASTELRHELPLRRVKSFADLRAVTPVLDAEQHAEVVESKLGFGLDPAVSDALDAGPRAEVVARWRRRLDAATVPPLRTIVRMGRHVPRRLDAIFDADLKALVPDATLTTLARSDDAEGFLSELQSQAPDALVVSSRATLAWLESAARMPVERAVPSLRLVFAEHDLQTPTRSRLPSIHGGRFAGVGRVGLPGVGDPLPTWTLAVGSCLLELLPEGDPDGIARARTETVLPERASLGQRYELVVSGPSGFLRARTGIHVRVVGFDARSASGRPRAAPRVVDIPPPPLDLALEGVTLPGSWVTAAVRQAFRAEDPALVDARAAPLAIESTSTRRSAAASDVFDGTELAGLSGPRSGGAGRPPGFIVYVEVQGASDPRFSDGLATRIDDALRRRSAPYDFLRNREEL